MTDDLLIGNSGTLPWHIPADLKHFKEITDGGIVVMGKNTYLSLPETYRPLPNRRNIVLSRSGFDEIESYSSIKEMLQILENE